MTSHLPLRATVLDASHADRAQLCALLAVHPAIDVRGAASSIDEARKILDAESASLLFCALGENPTNILEWLADRSPLVDVILVASGEEWAAQAFEIDALDFLVKPVTASRLNRTVRRLLRLDWSRESAATEAGRVFVPFERGRRMISIDEICAIHAIGNYTQILLAGGATEIAMRPLRRWEETLPPDSFLRIHRSTLASTRRLRRIETGPSGDGYMAEIEGLPQKLSVSRRCLTVIRAALRRPK